MPRQRNNKPLYDYNIYRILPEKAESFKSFLEDRRFEEIPLKPECIRNSSGYTFTLMFCDKDNRKGSPWVNLLSTCTEWDLSQELKIYGAALICYREDSCFVVSYGNAHFYVSDYCDYNFGVAVAERLIDLDQVRAQQNISHGSKLSKMHMDYLGGTVLSYRSGEIPTYIRGTSLDTELWGTTINCGTSAQFKWEEKPTEIGRKLNLLNEVIKADSQISLPRLTFLDTEEESEKIESLYHQLAVAIEQYNGTGNDGNLINVPSFYMMGTRLIQNDSVRFKLSCNHKSLEFDGELSINAINEFVEQKGFALQEVIQRINISVEYANDAWTNRKPIAEYLEFITADNFCLRNGKWCSFNIAYLDRIFQEAKRVTFINHTRDTFALSKDDVVQFAKENGFYDGTESRQPYETFYNQNVSQLLGATCLHPQTVSVDPEGNGRYKYEVCDFFKDQALYFVKIGKPNDFAYAIDQAMLTLEKCEAGMGALTLPGDLTVSPTEFRMVLIFDGRTNTVEKWEDVFSINFLIHLTELKRRLSSTDISLIIDFVYW